MNITHIPYKQKPRKNKISQSVGKFAHFSSFFINYFQTDNEISYFQQQKFLRNLYSKLCITEFSALGKRYN